MRKKLAYFQGLILVLLTVFSVMPQQAMATETLPPDTPGVTAEIPEAYADATELACFEYTVDPENGTVILTKYIGTGTAVVVAPRYILDGIEYSTVLDSSTVFYKNTKIVSVKLYEGVRFANNSMSYLFAQCSKLKTADLKGVDTTGVTEMTYVFQKCGQLTTVDVTGLDTSRVTTMYALFSECGKLANLIGYEEWDTGSLENMFWMFNGVKGMTVIDLRSWDLSHINNSAWCFQNCAAKQILLPDNLKTMSAGFLNHASSVTGSTFTIPAGVEKIGYAHTIYDFATGEFVEFIVPESNQNYVAIDGILYSADGKEMLAVPRAKTFTNNTYEIPEGVEFLGELSFSRNYNIHTLVLPNSFELDYPTLYDPRYIVFEDIGNLNVASNLTIAIYCYTGITDYAVKDDNPRYASLDGIVYSKDMSTVMAIPSRYDRLMNIPEGVTSWYFEAMWGIDHATPDSLLSKCPGVYIPSTLTDISQDQFAKLNRLNKRFANFEITVHPDNPVYSVDDNGYLIVTGAVVARNTTTRASYATLAEAVADCKPGETVALLTDIVLDQAVAVTGDVTISGQHTITRTDDYTGTLFNVSRGAVLTLEGGITVDGGNAWVFEEQKFQDALESFKQSTKNQYSGLVFATKEEGAPVATQNMIVVDGDLVVNDAVIRNHFGNNGTHVILLGASGKLEVNAGALLTHNVSAGSGTVLHMTDGSEFVMNGGEISGNHGILNGGCIYNKGGIMTMNGGSIRNNYQVNGNGSAIMLYTGEATLIMNGGEICGNKTVCGNNCHGGAVYIHSTGIVEMNGGTICHNVGVSVGGVFFNNQNATMTVNGGYIGENVNQLVAHANMVAAWGDKHDVAPNNYTYFYGGTYTTDLTKWLTEGYFMVDNGDGTYSVAIDPACGKVAYIADEAGEKTYFADLQAAVDAAGQMDEGTVVTLMCDITLDQPVTVTGDVILSGEYTITRTDDYTGTLFNISRGAVLTLEGGVTLDGGNAWVFEEQKFQDALESFKQSTKNQYSGLVFATKEEGAPVATQNMIVVDGGLVVNDAVIRNHFGNNGTHVILLGATGKLEVNAGALLTHNVSAGSGTVLHMTDGSEFLMNGGEISGNHGILNGGCIYNKGGIMTMNGGSIRNNYQVNGNGSAIMLYTGEATLIMNGGEICGNKTVCGNNCHGGAVYIHSTGIVEMNGGSICHNVGVSVGGVFFNNQNATMTVNGGYIGENVNQLVAHANMVAAWGDKHDVAPNNYTYFNGGTYTTDLTKWLTEGYFMVDNGDGTYTVVAAPADGE